MNATVRHGDALQVLAGVSACSVHAVVTDPPYGLAELPTSVVTETTRRWVTGERDYVPAGRGFMGRSWDRYVPPPALWDEVFRVLAPGGHAAVFAAGRTVDLMGLSLRLAGFEVRDLLGWANAQGSVKTADLGGGWRGSMKPALEPILLARKPVQGNLAANHARHGTGALNLSQCLVPFADEADRAESVGKNQHATFGSARPRTEVYGDYSMVAPTNYDPGEGRLPPNLLLDQPSHDELEAASEGSGRFFPVFFTPKAPRAERPVVDGVAHNTVKPLQLMRWLVRLLSAPGHLILDPFAGSGTTAEAALLEGRNALVIEADPAFLPLIQARVDRAA